MRCSQCQLVRINGVVCHETGCPLSHVGTVRECTWCGSEFEPEERGQRFCDESCGRAYFGLPEEYPGEVSYAGEDQEEAERTVRGFLNDE